MSAINGICCSGLDPSQMMQGRGDKFTAADKDGNEAVSELELTAAMEESGLDASKTEKMFARMDSNGDGEVSYQEHQDMMNAMEQRMGSLMGKGTGSEEVFDSIQTLMEALQSESENAEEKQQLQDALDKMRTEGYSESTMSESLSLINGLIPGIDITV